MLGLAVPPPGPVADSGGFPWLTLVTFAPLAGAVVAAVFPSRALNLHRVWALLVTIVTFALSLAMLAVYQGGTGLQLVERATWVGPLNFQYILGIDGISLFMVLLTTFLMPAAVLVSWRIEQQAKYYMIAFLILETAMIGAFLALDLLLFFLFFEALLFPMYLIIGGWGSDRRVYAAVKFFLFTMAGSAFLLVSILFLYFRAGSQLRGGSTFDFTMLQQLTLPATTARWLFLGFFVAFAVKVPLVPLHTWLPDAHTEAPTAGSLILAAVLLKIGAYGLIRFNLGLFPEASRFFRVSVMVLAVIGIVYGAAVALIQTDVKRLVAYSSVSHLGFVVLGTFAFTLQAMSGGVLQMVNHGLSTGALFLLVGMLYDRTHTRDLGKMGGLGTIMPALAGVFLFVALSSVGLPGLNGFVGEFLVLLGTFIVSKAFAVAAVVAVVLAAVYLLWAYQRMMHGAVVNEEHRRLPDLSLREYAILVPIMAGILVIGVFPKPLLDKIEPAARQATTCVIQTNQAAPSRQGVQLAPACSGSISGAPLGDVATRP
jgi:NADH-quinone oxidoreductase subunit M